MLLNGTDLAEFSAPENTGGDPGVEVDFTVFLTAGINRIALKPSIGENALAGLDFTLIDLTLASGPVSSYEAEAPGNTLAGATVVMEDLAASEERKLGDYRQWRRQFPAISRRSGC